MAKKMFISFILDETGSMQSVKGQTISGFNEYVETLKGGDDAGRIRFALTRFNDEKVDVVYDGVRLDEVAELTEETYWPTSLTPLYDAIGHTIRALEKRLAGKKRKVLVVIQTDGAENASKEFTQGVIFSLISEKKGAGWTFAFLGADQDAYQTGARLGIERGNVMEYTSGETHQTFGRTATATLNYVSSGGKVTTGFFDSETDSSSDAEKSEASGTGEVELIIDN